MNRLEERDRMYATSMLAQSSPGRARYSPPGEVAQGELQPFLRRLGREVKDEKQFDLLRGSGHKAVFFYYSGDLEVLHSPTVSIVGTREVSDEGWKRASRLARELAFQGVTVMSGLARGVDTAALTSAIRAEGRVAAVIGTPLNKAYPAENSGLQEEIYKSHLLLSPFGENESTHRSNFPKRNRVMALLSDATVIVEASDTSGTLHQAAECLRQGRWLFILQSVMDDPRLTWPRNFVGKPRVGVIARTSDVLDALAK